MQTEPIVLRIRRSDCCDEPNLTHFETWERNDLKCCPWPSGINVDKLHTDELAINEKIKFWRSTLFEIPGSKSGNELVRVGNELLD